MKNNKNLIFICLLTLIILSGCKKYLDDAFANPNKPVNANPDIVFPSVISTMPRGIQFDGRFLNNYVQYWARTDAGNVWDFHGYVAGTDNAGDIWRSHYFGFGQNILNIIRDGRTSGKFGYSGAGYAILAWSWLLLTDYHGEVILKEAFRPDQLTFKYDTQEEVYEHVKMLTDSALFYLGKAEGQPANSFSVGDQNLYGGNISKWTKFTYGVKAMVHHRYIMKGTYNADSVILNIDKSFSSPADDAMVKFPLSTVTAQENFYGPRRANLGTLRQSDYVIRLMNGTIFPGGADPRMKYLFKPAQDGQYRGLETGRGESVLAVTQRPPNHWGFYTTTSPAAGIDTGARVYFKNNSLFPILTYSQMQFIKAEAAFKNGDKTTALAAYKNGITGSIDHLKQYYTGYIPMSDADIAAFMANTKVVPTLTSELTLSQIMLQKYLALWPWNGEETWVDLRKYQYSTSVYTGWIFPTAFFSDNGGLPVQRARPRYNSEYLWNVDELRKIGGLDPNYHTKPVWFSLP